MMVSILNYRDGKYLNSINLIMIQSLFKTFILKMAQLEFKITTIPCPEFIKMQYAYIVKSVSFQQKLPEIAIWLIRANKGL